MPGASARAPSGVDEDEYEEHSGSAASNAPPAKKAKFHRAKTSCLPCRTRKGKCGASPPDSCKNCDDWGIDCIWPESDGRSTRAKKGRSQNDIAIGGASQSATPSTSSARPTTLNEASSSSPQPRILGPPSPSSIFTPPPTAPGTPPFSQPSQVAVDAGPMAASSTLFHADGAPSPVIKKHLLKIFFRFFGCLFLFLDERVLLEQVDRRDGSNFMMDCIAGIAARFSEHPSIALAGLAPSAFGNLFYDRAKSLLGSILGVPSRETIAGMLMLAHVSFANDLRAEVGMFMGLAVQAAIMMRLHEEPHANISESDHRLGRLTFFTVLLLDHTLSLPFPDRQMAGRYMSLSSVKSTLTPPSPADFPRSDAGSPGSPFIYASKMALAFAPLIDIDLPIKIPHLITAIIEVYSSLPLDLEWSSSNLQQQVLHDQGPIFLYLHLWMHTILLWSGAYGLDTDPKYPFRNTGEIQESSLRTICEILTLSEIICPKAYLSLPFAHETFRGASLLNRYGFPFDRQQPSDPCDTPLDRDIRARHATLRIALAKQAVYWGGIHSHVKEAMRPPVLSGPLDTSEHKD